MTGVVTAVSRNEVYSFTKPNRESVTLLVGLGVDGDVHAGVTVKHRSRVAQDPTQPNLRQVHLIHEELFGELAEAGFRVAPGELGENVTTRGLDLLALPVGTLLRIGAEAGTRACRSTTSRTGCSSGSSGATRPAVSCARPGSWASSRRAVWSTPATRSRWSCRTGRTGRWTASDLWWVPSPPPIHPPLDRV